MACKRKGRPVSGVLLLDKAQGESSNYALQRTRGLFTAEKAGHGGTLDPFAQGLLPILFGEATKFGRYILGANKGYRVSIRFGRETTTDDGEGQTTREKPIPRLAAIDWEQVLSVFTGEQMQVPPVFSALKVKGKRAYELARKGEMPEMQPRLINIHSLCLNHVEKECVSLTVYCSKGTYIRALARDIGRYLDSAAFAQELRRTDVGHWGEHKQTKMYRFETLEQIKNQDGYQGLDALLLPLDCCVQDFAKLVIPAEKVIYIRHGNDIAVDIPDGCYALYNQDIFFGIGKAKSGRIYPERLCAV